MIFKALLLQSWYKLSDSALEKQLARDLLFRRFIALDTSEPVPDHSTIWRFRQKLYKLLLMDKLLQEINSQLIDQGLILNLEVSDCLYKQTQHKLTLGGHGGSEQAYFRAGGLIFWATAPPRG
ncbi:MAG: transposase [Candidatus Endonucleobacter bathymodioli]|uniref:Transposase n=1 Tax=Candidatus Endonucleibacter bathymodioli TaxID=539814 RepID=A0AA90NR34_9GAMM|nr:transposase [Candidatus Endonucleobacter bathymodioli]